MLSRLATRRLIILSIFILTFTLTAFSQGEAQVEPLPKLPPVREQLEIRERWLKVKLETMLPMMRRHKIDMWIVVNEEFHPDPAVPYVAPPIPYQGRRDYFIFSDRGVEQLERIAVVRYPEERLKRFFEVMNPPGRETAATLS